MEMEIKSVQDLVAIVKRRRWNIIVPAAVIFCVAAILVFVLPPVYRSTSTILIEEQEVPRDYVNSTVTGYAESRLQTINQRIMGATRLLEIITRFDLYPELKRKKTTEEIVAKLRKDIKFETISADVIDPRSGQRRPATIAFTLSYQGKNPQMVQKVASELASLYLEENLAVRSRQSLGTTKFMEDEMKTVQVQLRSIDAQISAYKQRNVNTLPELVQANMQSMDSTDREVVSLTYQLRTLKERESNLHAQLATTPADAGNQDKARLSELRVKLGEMKTRLTDQHPDVIKAKSEVAELVKQLRAGGQDPADNKPDNPAYIALKTQLAGVRSEITSTKQQIENFNRKKDNFQRRIAASPGVEEGYKNILLQRNNLQQKYDDLSRKFMEAKVSNGLEKEQKGERFTIIDAARLPEKPVSPNVPAIILIGLIFGIGSGTGLAAIREQSDQTVRSPLVLARATGFPVLACIPEIVNEQDHGQVRSMRWKLIMGGMVLLVAAIVLFHFFVMDLDVFWARAMRRFGI
jgi:polysaccharide biosynthesis transport protein